MPGAEKYLYEQMECNHRAHLEEAERLEGSRGSLSKKQREVVKAANTWAASVSDAKQRQSIKNAARYNLGALLGHQGDIAGAETEYRRAIEMDTSIDTADKRLLLQKYKKDIKSAEAAYKRAVDNLVAKTTVT